VPLTQIQKALDDPRLQQAVYSATGRLAEGRRKTVSGLPDYQKLRQHAHDIKKHTLDHLDRYLEELERNVVASGGHVVWANTAAEACDFVSNLARERGVTLVVKSKSMTTEEIHLNHHLEHRHIEAVETDLGEYIIQLSGETPYHIIAPALHKTREQVAGILHADAGATPETLTAMARAILRKKFLEAGIGITGANFLVADSGAIVLVENEGNARLSSSAPKIHVAIAGIEKVVPRAQDLAVFLKLLARSATGQALSVYTSFLAGPRRAGESDGPEEFYLVLLDHGRTQVLADQKKRQSLYCIRCGACLNTCPVYRKIGGYSYPWVYSGPIGKILTPQFAATLESEGSDMNASWLPFASSLCGACGEVCPVKIEIPKILLELRQESPKKTPERLAMRMFSWIMRHPRVYEQFRWVRKMRTLPSAGPLKAWLSQRDLPELPARSFREEWKRRG
jgi:L-lactate dehydrogenase complex protein LldF